jgi:hypothetical protein
MNLPRFLLSCAAALLALGALPARADVVHTLDGAQIVGRVTGVREGRIVVETTYAGEVAVLQNKVKAITTDRPLTIQLADGTQMEGTLAASASGALLVVTPMRTIPTSVAKVRNLWPTTADRSATFGGGEEAWSYELNTNVSGRTGNKEQLTAALGFRATRMTSVDTLQFRADYERQATSGVKSADQLRLNGDFQQNLGERTVWYARGDTGYDDIRDLNFYAIAAGGYGYDLIKQDGVRITARAGLSFRFENFGNPGTKDIAAPGADFGLSNVMNFGGPTLVNRITYIQGFDAADSFRLAHESYFELPTSPQNLRVRLGIAHDYNSRVGQGVEKLDTTYYAQIVLSWR